MRPLELWGGVECTVNRVGDCYFDQLRSSGHDHRVEDLDLFATLGLAALRYPVLWERVATRTVSDLDWTWADQRLTRLRELGIAPIVGLLHHGSGPSYTSLVDERFPRLLAQYARAVAERYPWVVDWTPVNEPLTTARFSGLYGHWYPHGRDPRTFVRALLNQLRGVVLAMREIRAVNPAARLVQTEDLGRTSGTPALDGQIDYERHRRWLTWDLLCGLIDVDHPLHDYLVTSGASPRDLEFFREHSCPPDIVGINYYLTSDRWLDERLERYPPCTHGGNGHLAYADVEAVRASAAGITGHEQHLLAAWHRYRRPVALTEVHLGCTREEQMRWLYEAWLAALRARDRGADVRAVTVWALLGSYDWDSLVTSGRGSYEPGAFDVRGPRPRATAVSVIARDLAATGAPDHPVLQTAGWWRRSERLRFGHARGPFSATGSPAPRPILVAGVRGTLARALQRIAASRGLRVELVGRPEMDICDPFRVDAVLRRLNPWAVINAAGYVRVDAAEADRHGCWKSNVTGVVNLAAACRRRGVQLVTFSSDLVFDGSAQQPYLEHDAPAPLNVYGSSKADAERRCLDVLPEALVIRTSAFFGPWDEYNFATAAARTLAEGRCFPAAADCHVSPTYVPDLVNATLDLLIDGERGIWHLANAGALTWYDFACAVGRAAGLNDRLVAPCSWRDVWQPAERPRYSVLGTARGQLMRPLDAAVRAYVADRLDFASSETLEAASSSARH